MSEEPAWDGRGRDPWLPSRLAGLAEIRAAERDVRDGYWAALSSWLVTTARRVLRGSRPDPEAVWARAPEWADLVDEFTTETVRPVMSRAYERLLGEDFDFQARPRVAAHLAGVRNRMVGVPDEVYDLIASQIAQGADLGEGIPKLADRVEEVLSTTATPRWQNRATVAARTETMGALNAGRSDAFAAVVEETGQPMEQVWISTVDDRTRETHVDADGQRRPVGEPFDVGGAALMFPGDPDGPAEETIQCRCTVILTEPGEETDMSNRQFLGG